jgi:hypothetical protein
MVFRGMKLEDLTPELRLNKKYMVNSALLQNACAKVLKYLLTALKGGAVKVNRPRIE